MAETMFPQRQRCKTCRAGLGRRTEDPVLLGLYCSAKCAGRAAPTLTPDSAPRECVTQRGGRWAFKRRYRSVEEIPGRILEQAMTDHYWCQHCGHLHVGRTRARDDETFRMFNDPVDVADFLIKRRGKATRSDVARVAGVRPIRLKELETGVAHPEGLTTLFKVLAVLRARPGVALQSFAPEARR